jgi:hypothetical protein
MRLRMLVVVYNDAAYGVEVHHFESLGAPLNIVRYPGVDFAALAGVTVRRPEDLEPVRACVRAGMPARCSSTPRSCRPSSPTGLRRPSGATNGQAEFTIIKTACSGG